MLRGTQIAAQDLEDSDFTLVVDKANYFAFKLDDIEAAQSHINWMSMASDRAAYRLRDNFDQDVLGYMCGFEQAAQPRGCFGCSYHLPRHQGCVYGG
jgi:hypothetical protein